MKNLFKRGRQFVKNNPLSINYGIDGLLVLGAASIASNNNNLFAQRLGAGDFHLSMVQALPPLVNLFLLIPIGLLIDSLVNKRRVVSICLLMSGIFFAIVSMSAFIPIHAVYFFLLFLALANISMGGMFNLAWQAFFPEAVEEKERNNVLTFRARMTMIVSLVFPLIVGFILVRIPSDEGKIVAHQIFYVIVVALLFANLIHFRKIKSVIPSEPKHVSMTEIKMAGFRLLKNKPFIIFTLVILFFHMTWHMDWTLYFIGQANYMHMNEFMLSLTPVVGTLAQLVTLRFWSRNNTKQGVERPMVYGMLGLAICPIAMIVGVSLPLNVGPFAFLILHAIGHLSFASVALNMFQCLLKVVDNEYRSFSISIYTFMITLSHAIMPIVGVAVYRALGGHVDALRYTFAILFVLRIVAAGLWLLWLNKTPLENAPPSSTQAH